MSKCDLKIVFDRTDRRYRGGEEVSGTVYVEVNQDVECKGILVERFWQTHGRGNAATGPKRTTVVYRGNLRAGQSLSYPFRFAAADGPPTYHGRYLNVDHYVNVRVDIPWAFDPKLKEEYILLPGAGRYGNLPGPATRAPGLKSRLVNLGAPVGVAMILFGMVLLFPCGLVLIPLGLVALFFSLRKWFAEKRIGKVRLSWGSLHVPPGGNLPLRLAFTPRQSSRLNRIAAELVGKERCVSGSGTNRRTHTHKFYQQTTILAPECEVTAGEPLRVEGVVPIPETNAFSFHARDNDLIWELEVRVDIPLWPDWIEKRMVVVRPEVAPEVVEAIVVEEPSPAAQRPEPVTAVPAAGHTGRFTGEETIPAEPAAAADVEQPLQQQKPDEASDFAEFSQPEPPAKEQPAPSAASTDPALVEIVKRIGSADRYGGRREAIIKEQSEESFDCAIEVTKVERTYSYIPDDRFRRGRTVTGKLRGTDCQVSVQVIEARSEEFDSLKPGDLVQANCRLLKWNAIYDRLEMRET